MMTIEKTMMRDLGTELKPLNDILAKIGLEMTGVASIENYLNLCYFNDNCLFTLKRVSETAPNFLCYWDSIPDGDFAAKCIESCISHISGKTFRRYQYTMKGNEIIDEVSLPVFSLLMELEMKLKLMGKIQ